MGFIMIFSKFRICSSLIFLFIILSYPVSGAKKPLDELSQDAEEIMKHARHTDVHKFQRGLEDHVLNILESTGYSTSGSEIYLDPQFLVTEIELQRNQLDVLSKERDRLHSYDPMLTDFDRSTRLIKDLSHALERKQNELDLQTTKLYLKRLEVQYGLLWGPDTTPESHKSSLFPQNIERKRGWSTSIYYADPCNMMFIVSPNDYHDVEKIFNSLFTMFSVLYKKHETLSQSFPKALTSSLRTRFELFKANDRLHTAGQWGRNFILSEQSFFDNVTEHLRSELRILKFQLSEMPASSNRDDRSPSPVLLERLPDESLVHAERQQRTLSLEAAFANLRSQTDSLEKTVLSDSKVILLTLMPDTADEEATSTAEGASVLTQLNLKVIELNIAFKTLLVDIERNVQLFQAGKLLPPFNSSAAIHTHFAPLEKSLRLFESRYAQLLFDLTQINENLKEQEMNAGFNNDAIQEQVTRLFMSIADRELEISSMKETLRFHTNRHHAAEKKLTQAQRHTQLLEVNEHTERYFDDVDRMISASLAELCSAFEIMGRRTLEALEQTMETFNKQTFTETQALEIVGKTNALESQVQHMDEQMEEALRNFHIIFQDASSTRATHIPDLEPLLFHRINSMQTVTDALRTLYEKMHHISSTTSMPVIQRTKSVLQPTSDIPTLLREFRELSPSVKPTLLVEQNTHQLLHQFQTLTTKFLSDIASLTLIPKDDLSSAPEIIATA